MDGPPPIDHVPEKYRNAATSEITLIIEPDSDRQELEYDVPKE